MSTKRPINGWRARIWTASRTFVIVAMAGPCSAYIYYTTPPVDTGVTTTIGTATEFLYTGPNPIHTGFTPGTIAPEGRGGAGQSLG